VKTVGQAACEKLTRFLHTSDSRSDETFVLTDLMTAGKPAAGVKTPIQPMEDTSMIWFILTPFLILCLATLGLTFFEALDYLRARSWKPGKPTLSGSLGERLPFDGRPSFYPGEIDSYVSSLSTRKLASTD
jgi:hypothetical protein